MIADAASADRAAFARRFDVCVIGSGPAGITLARRLAAAGAEVALMEAGGEAFTDQSQDLYKGESIGHDYFPLEAARLRYFGGTSNHWYGRCHALVDVDFVPKPYNPLSAWPIGKGDLDPYAAEADAILDLADGRGAPDIPPQAPGDAFVRHHFRFSPPTRFAEKYRDEIAGSERIHLFLNANLVDIRLSDDLGQVTGAVFRGYASDDPGFTMRAECYALCAGGIENPRLLLNFRRQMPEGIGNRYGLVGRYFSEHIHLTLADVLLTRPRAEAEYFAAAEQFILENEVLNFSLNLDPVPERGPPPFLTAAKRSAACAAPFIERLAERVMGRPIHCYRPALADWWAGGVTPDNPSAIVYVSQEQALNPESRVTLGEGRDALGLQTTVLDWQLLDLDFHTMRTAVLAFGEYLAERDFGRARVRDWLLAEPAVLPRIGEDDVAEWHHMGTTRMADDPRYGVVDRDCRVHGIANLYIGGSSVFCTGGFANPTYSLVQLALRLGDHLASRLTAG